MNLSPRYWLRRWLVPELELSPAEIARRQAEYEECVAQRQRLIAEFEAQTGRLEARWLRGSQSDAAHPTSGRTH